MPAAVDQFQWTHVGAFGGGLDYTKNPSALEPDQWAESTGFFAMNGFAETAPRLMLVADLSGLLHPTDQIIGIVQEPNSGNALVGTVDVPPFGVGRLFRVTRAGVVTEITNSLIVPTGRLVGNQSAVLQGAFINGKLILNFGFVPAGGLGLYSSSIVYDTAVGTTYDVNFPGTYFHFLTGFAAHGVGAFGHTIWNGTIFNQSASREVTWTPANVETFDIPSIANDADDVILDDMISGITLLAPLGQSACGIFTRNVVSVLAPTGGIPAFTRQLIVQGIGARQITTFRPDVNFRGQTFWGNTPAGLVVATLDNLYRITQGGGVDAIGTPIFDAWAANTQPTADPSLDYHQTFVWDEHRSLLLCPLPKQAGVDWFAYEAKTGAWSRQVQQAPAVGTFARSAYIWSLVGSAMRQEYWCATQQQVYIEDADLPIAAGYVETKDFCFGDPATFAYIDRIKVDWECLTNPTTDTITILAAARDGLAPGMAGDDSLRIVPLTFAVQGSLQGGASELNLRLKCKWVRFRIEQQSGRVRIRGLHIRWQAASDVKTP